VRGFRIAMGSRSSGLAGRTVRVSPGPEGFDRSMFEHVASVLQRGGIVAYPTETLYGIGVDPFHPTAVERLFQLKGRPETMPVSLIVRDLEMLAGLVESLSPIAERIVRTFLPGPLTVVLPARKGLPEAITAASGKVGLRISSHPLLSGLFMFYPFPLISTSANPSGQPPATDAGMVQEYFPEGIDCLIDAGPTPLGMPSTVIDLCGERPVFLREGALSRAEFYSRLGTLPPDGPPTGPMG